MTGADETQVAAWLLAGQDLGVTVMAPFEEGNVTCTAFLPEFGSRRGMLLLDRRRTSLREARDLAAEGWAFSFVDWSSYDRPGFEDALCDWGWIPSTSPPDWFRAGGA